jgi:hypothetical protein
MIGRFARFTVGKKSPFLSRTFGAHAGGHGHHGPHVPEGYEKIGSFVLLVGYLWIMYRLKEDKGQLFGLYKPWLHEHEHEHHHFELSQIDQVPQLAEHDHDEHDEEEEH